MNKAAKIALCAMTLVMLAAIGASAATPEEALVSGDWIGLTRQSQLPGISEDYADAPDPELLSRWWNALGDETLTGLIERALLKNRSLQQARAAVSEARAALGITKASLVPWLDNTDTWTRGKTPSNSTGDGVTREIYRLGLDASWEIDIFGGTRESVRAGVADLEASHASLHSAWVSLSSEVALSYLTLRTLQERYDIAMENLALQTESLQMVSSRFEVGLSDALALSQAQYTVEQTRAGIPTIQAGIEEVTNALAVLVGEVPGSLAEELRQVKSLPKPDGVGLEGIPANYLRQRPDIRAAERRLAAQIARRKSAEKDMLPKFTLVGSIGLESLSSGSLFASDSQSFSFGPRITLPIFHGGAIRSNIRVQSAREEQLLASYEQTVLSAVGELRNALYANIQERSRNEAIRSGVEAARTAAELAVDKYKNGLTDFSNVINAQSALLSLEEQYVVSEGEITSNIVRIFKALGGGWASLAEMEEEQVTSDAAKL